MKFTFLAADRPTNTLPTMATTGEVPGEFELYHSVLDNLVQVRNRGKGVVVRLTRDNFSATAKTSFIRHLALEGFIPDRYQWYSESSGCPSLEVKWVIDGSWVRIHHQLSRHTSRVLNHLSRGRLLALGLFVAAFIVAVWLKRP